MSLKLAEAALQSSLPTIPRFVLFVIGDNGGLDGGTLGEVNNAAISCRTGLSSKQIQKAIKWLEAKNVIRLLPNNRARINLGSEWLRGDK